LLSPILFSLLLSPLLFPVPLHSCPLGCACPRYLVALVWLPPVPVRHVVVLLLVLLLPPLLQPPLVLHARPPPA
jgi:hypothetical protein